MKTHLKFAFPLCQLAAGLGLLLAGPAPAQTLTNIYSFSGSDGAYPWAGLIVSGNTLYGTTRQGGTADGGLVFSINTDGSGFTKIYSFLALGDGSNPSCDLALGGSTLYGTANFAGTYGFGVVFAVNTDGTGFTNLYSFPGGSDGKNPYAGLALSGGILYGTTLQGNVINDGGLFAIGTDGSGYHNVFLFDGGIYGANPYAGVIISGSTLYGTAKQGGDAGSGTVYKLNTDGSGLTELHGFTDTDDGGVPYARPLLANNILYGTTFEGGSAGLGTVYAVSTSGTGFTNLHSFRGGNDGANPYAPLVLVGNKLYGTTSAGGNSGNGTLFVVNTDGSGYSTLYTFKGTPDGSQPYGGLVASGNKLFGTTVYGGTTGDGTVFCLSLGGSAPQLTIHRFGPDVVLTWPAADTGFTLQSTTDLTAAPAWTPVSPSPVLVNNQFTVTNAISGSRTFYRLMQ